MAAANSPSCSKAIRIAAASVSETTNIPGAWGCGPGQASGMCNSAPSPRQVRTASACACGAEAASGASMVMRRVRGSDHVKGPLRRRIRASPDPGAAGAVLADHPVGRCSGTQRRRPVMDGKRCGRLAPPAAASSPWAIFGCSGAASSR
jgi:hypothetical protein